jgi:hypothetical protein
MEEWSSAIRFSLRRSMSYEAERLLMAELASSVR